MGRHEDASLLCLVTIIDLHACAHTASRQGNLNQKSRQRIMQTNNLAAHFLWPCEPDDRRMKKFATIVEASRKKVKPILMIKILSQSLVADNWGSMLCILAFGWTRKLAALCCYPACGAAHAQSPHHQVGAGVRETQASLGFMLRKV